MPKEDYNNPEYVKFFTETCEKTARLRQKWNCQNWERIQDAAVLKREDKGITDLDVLKVSMLGGLAATTRDHAAAGCNRVHVRPTDGEILGISSIRKGHSIPELGIGDPKEDPRLARPDTDLTPDPIMRPVDLKQKALLTKPGPENGRLTYIKSRNKVLPEDKYYFPETSGWVYGWRLKDSGLANKGGPLWPKSCVLTEGCKSRTGPRPDPDYYKDPDAIQVFNKCAI